MASKSLFGVAIFLALLPSIQSQGNNNNNNFNLAIASRTLSEKGYHTMSMIFEVFFNTQSDSEWLTANSTLTVFCPPDHVSFSSKYPQPPLTLLQYHVVPLKLDIESLKSIPHGSKLDTLLLGHPLVVTTLPIGEEYPSLNGVKITEWNVYKDGGLIVHGVENFFDPAFQTLIYPWFDVMNDSHAQVASGFSLGEMRAELTDNWLLVLGSAVIGVSLLVFIFCYYYREDQSDGDDKSECLLFQISLLIEKVGLLCL